MMELKMNRCGGREENYGKPEDNFRIVADLWSAYLDKRVFPEDVAIMMELLKIARIIDLTGYAARGGKIATTEG